jgi:hypothetical protein
MNLIPFNAAQAPLCALLDRIETMEKRLEALEGKSSTAELYRLEERSGRTPKCFPQRGGEAGAYRARTSYCLAEIAEMKSR